MKISCYNFFLFQSCVYTMCVKKYIVYFALFSFCSASNLLMLRSLIWARPTRFTLLLLLLSLFVLFIRQWWRPLDLIRRSVAVSRFHRCPATTPMTPRSVVRHQHSIQLNLTPFRCTLWFIRMFVWFDVAWAMWFGCVVQGWWRDRDVRGGARIWCRLKLLSSLAYGVFAIWPAGSFDCMDSRKS